MNEAFNILALDYLRNLSTTPDTHKPLSILVPNLPPLGSSPISHGTTGADSLNEPVSQYNKNLDLAMNYVQDQLPNANIFGLDVFTLVSRIISNPEAFGLVNVTDAAYDEATGHVVSNPDQYLFWDGVQFTARVHQLLAEAAMEGMPGPIIALGAEMRSPSAAAAPEPGTVAILGLGALLAMKRRRG